MGCSNSKPNEQAFVAPHAREYNSNHQQQHNQNKNHAKPHLSSRSSGVLSSNFDHDLKFREELFQRCGQHTAFNNTDAIIEEGKPSESAIYIKKGNVLLKKSNKEIARRGAGDLIGEMTFLLGDTPGVTVVAEGAVEAYVLTHSALVDQLRDDPRLSGKLFKMFATTLSDRIAEASAKMRAEVVAKRGGSTKRGTVVGLDRPAQLSAAKMRAHFGLTDSTERLLLSLQCSMRKEENALTDSNVQVGDLHLFDAHLCFDWKVFGFHKQQVLPLRNVLAFLQKSEGERVVEVQVKGQSYELTISAESYESAVLTMEAARRGAHKLALQEAALDKAVSRFEEVDLDEGIEAAFNLGGVGSDGSAVNSGAADMALTESDWNLFLAGAKQRRYRKGEYVLHEGKPTSALYQILQGELRVELNLKGSADAVVVGHRSAGEMFGETSLLKAGVATASIVIDSESAVLMCLDGEYLDTLFKTNPQLPGRFFAFLASYQAQRLREVTEMVSRSKHETAATNVSNIRIDDLLNVPAYIGILRKFMFKRADSDKANESRYAMLLAMFEFWMDVRDYKTEPSDDEMRALAAKIIANFVAADAPMLLSCFDDEERAALSAAVAKWGAAPRQLFDAAQRKVVTLIDEDCFEEFVQSEHFAYINELKAKENVVPGLTDFRLIRVLGQGGFGQVLEVTKRDCGKNYAMKVMSKDLMRRCLGSSWRKKIWLEKDLMSCLSHPFLVNLHYAFQNLEYLVLVMDLVPAGDLSEFVLTKKRMTADQVRFVVMETVCVVAFIHSQDILYRDLKPENLLIDQQGHVRLIDMGLAARVTDKTPRRRSRVGTDCYMAPEVRFAKERREPYGRSCDWYTVGVLTYEFSAGNVPFARPDEQPPTYRPHEFPNTACDSFVKGLLDQDHRSRLGCGTRGVDEILEHAYFGGIEWELVPLKKYKSPCVNLKGPPKKKKDGDSKAVQMANSMLEADSVKDESAVADWNFVSPHAITEEYMENVYKCVSNI